jgi:hypothetical protein
MYFFIGLALAAGIAAYNRIDQYALYKIEQAKIAYKKIDWNQAKTRLQPNFRRVKASAV